MKLKSLCKWIASACLVMGVSLTVLAEPTFTTVVKSPCSSEIFAPVAVPQVIKDGKYHFESTKLDMGTAASMFDGDYNNLIRTPQINPAYFQFVTDEPVSFRGMRIQMSEDKHDYVLSAAMNENDLKSKTGTYTVLEKGSTGFDGCIVFISPKPVKYSAFRLDAKRTTGDNYVHVLEWEFLEPVKFDSIEAEYLIRCMHGAGEPAKYEALTENSTRPSDSLLKFKVTGKVGDKSFDATNYAKIDVESKYGKSWRNGSAFQLTKPETVAVTVSAGGLTVNGNVKVLPRTVENNKMDLDVTYIQRLPKIDYTAPNGGWPLKGQPVVWRGHARNWGDKTVEADYRWTIDGKEVSTGKIKMKGGEEVTVDLPWNWEQKRHYITFEIDPNNKIDELVGHNNKLEIASDALTIGIYVEHSYNDFFHEKQYQLGFDDANGFEDWIQRSVRHWNKLLSRSRYSECPEGAKDRVRIDQIVYVPDQSLPFQNGAYPTNFPNLEDHSVDLIWGYPWKIDEFKDGIDIEGLKKKFKPSEDVYVDPFCLNFFVIHELSHARYLVDNYGFDVHAGDAAKPSIDIKDDQGKSILGTYLQAKGMVHHCHYGGAMTSEYEQYSPYEIVMLNRVAGTRARTGNCNGTTNIGEYLGTDIPKSFKIKFAGPNGEILANDKVKVYWAAPKEEWYGKYYDNVVDKEFTTDSEGCITTDKTFFDTKGEITHTWGFANTVAIVRIDHEGKTYYVFVEVSQVNMLYNLSKDPVPTLEIPVPLRTGEPTPLDPDWGRRKLPDWRMRTQFDMPK